MERGEKRRQLVNRLPLRLCAELFSLCCCADGLHLSAWLHQEQHQEAAQPCVRVCVGVCVCVCGGGCWVGVFGGGVWCVCVRVRVRVHVRVRAYVCICAFNVERF